MKRYYLVLPLIIIAIIVLGVFLIFDWVQVISYSAAINAEFRATMVDEGGVDVNSAFIISFDTEVSAASIQEYLNVTPQIELGFHQGSSKKEVLIAPAEPLAAGTIYTFTLATDETSLVWSFQTKRPLEIETLRPADRSIGVSLSETIEIVLNQMTTIDLSAVNQFVKIMPKTEGSFTQEGRILRFVPTNGLSSNTVYQVKIESGLLTANSDITLEKDYAFAFETVGSEKSYWQLSGRAYYLFNERPFFEVKIFDEAGSQNRNDEETTVKAWVYQFGSAEIYAASLIEMIEKHPCWSQSFENLCGLSTENTLLKKQYQFPADNGSFRIYLPETLPEGFYLLRCQYGKQTRDVLFAVSGIAAHMLNDQEQTLFWLHDADDNQPLLAHITDQKGVVSTETDANGLALVPQNGHTVYTIVADKQVLVLPSYQSGHITEDNFSNWRYLYLDQSSYESGETLNFWGFVKPRDGSKLTYSRVSVFISSLASGDYVYKNFAPLDGGIFSGNIILPTLLDGAYQLEIWQNKKILIAKSFVVGKDPVINEGSDDTISSGRIMLDNINGYAIGEDFVVSFPTSADKYLFIEEEEGIKKFYSGRSNKHSGIFAPANYLNSYLSCVAYNNGLYIEEQPVLLRRNASQNMIMIDIRGSLLGERSGQSGTFEISVTDLKKSPIAAGIAISVIQSETKPQIDTLSAIYGDYVPTRLKQSLSWQDQNIAATSGNCLFFTSVHTNENGIANCSYHLPEFSGNCWLIVQAINSNNNDVKAGSLVLPFGAGSAKNIQSEPSGEYVEYSYDLEALTEGTVLSDANVLTVFGSSQRLQLISRLLDSLFFYRANQLTANSAELALAAAHARQLLLDYGGDIFYPFAGTPIDIGLYQKTDGGIGDLGTTSSLATSVKAIATAPEHIDYHALLNYYDFFLENSSTRLEKIMALTGLALYGQPVLNDVKLMIAGNADLTDEEYLWLLWALYACGDKQNCQTLYREHFTNHDILNLPAASIAAILNALCGDRADSLKWLKQTGEEHHTPTNIENILVIRTILPQLQQQNMSFFYSVSGNEKKATIGGINDFILPAAESDNIQCRRILGEIYYLDIYQLE